jgi:hypothetical protein
MVFACHRTGVSHYVYLTGVWDHIGLISICMLLPTTRLQRDKTQFAGRLLLPDAFKLLTLKCLISDVYYLTSIYLPYFVFLFIVP